MTDFLRGEPRVTAGAAATLTGRPSGAGRLNPKCAVCHEASGRQLDNDLSRRALTEGHLLHAC
jgi:cytochrome c553